MGGKSTNAVMYVLKSDCQVEQGHDCPDCCIDQTASRVPHRMVVSSLKENKEVWQKEGIGCTGPEDHVLNPM